MTHKKIAILLLTICMQSFCANEIRHIIPPALDDTNLGTQIVCHRPMRIGTPRMEFEEIGDQIIIHNYGHGGSGWTLGPGCAQYVNTLLINSKYGKTLSNDTPIVIIGAGALGLFTAYNLVKKGFTRIIIIADQFNNLTSHNAGGLLAPVSMNNASEFKLIMDEIGFFSYRFYESIAKQINPDFKNGARIISTYFSSREESELESYVGKVMQPAHDVILDFGNGTKRPMVAYDDGIFIDTIHLMSELHSYLKKHNVIFEERHVTSFSELLPYQFIFNCSGLGSVSLNNDEKMVSVQGHLIMLKDQNPQDIQYMILTYFGNGVTESGQKITRSFYLFPKQIDKSSPRDIGVIGGTFIEGATSETPNREEFATIVKNAKNFYGLT